MRANLSEDVAAEWLHAKLGPEQDSMDSWSSAASLTSINASVAPALVSSLATMLWQGPFASPSPASSSALPLGSSVSSVAYSTPSADIASSLSQMSPNSSTSFPMSTTVQMSSTDNYNNTDQLDHNIYIQPPLQQILWSFIFFSMVFVAAGGNIIVIWIVLTHKRMASAK